MAWGIRTIVLIHAVSRATNFVPGFIFHRSDSDHLARALGRHLDTAWPQEQ
jgi:hypothetical protein